MQHQIFSLAFAVGLIGAHLFAPLLARGAELPEIKQRGYLIVAVKENLRPLGFRDPQGKLQGLEIDIAQRLAQELLGQLEAVKLQPVANQERIPLVLAQQVDLAIARVTATSSRDRLVELSIPYYFDGTALVTKNPALQKLRDVTRVKIAVLKGSNTIAIIRSVLPQAQLVGVDSYAQGQTFLETGKAEVMAADASVLSGWVQEYPEYHILPSLLSTEALCVVMPKGLQYTQLHQEVNQAIARWRKEGWLQERAAYWGLPRDREE